MTGERVPVTLRSDLADRLLMLNDVLIANDSPQDMETMIDVAVEGFLSGAGQALQE